MSMGEYYAIKDAENDRGEVDWSQVPVKFGGTRDEYDSDTE